jgi:hypothetical protein
MRVASDAPDPGNERDVSWQSFAINDGRLEVDPPHHPAGRAPRNSNCSTRNAIRSTSTMSRKSTPTSSRGSPRRSTDGIRWRWRAN